MVVESPSSAFGKGLNAACANWTESQAVKLNNPGLEKTEYQPCSVYVAATSEGLSYPDEVYRTLNSISSENQVLQVSTGNSTTGDLFLLGPAASLRSSNSDYKATTIGVSTVCKAISKLCNLHSPEGAATLFNCSSGWNGEIESLSYNPTALISAGYDLTTSEQYNYTSTTNNFGLGVFTDQNLTKAYEIMAYDLVNATHTTPNPFYLGVAALATSGANLSSDPQIVSGGHGGNAFVLTCQVNTYDVTYAYINGTISPNSITTVVNNGTVGWNFLGPISFQGNRLAQMVDLAAVQNSSAELALSYGNQFSSFATAMLAGAYDGRTVLEQQDRRELLVTKVLKSAIWLLILFNLLFAVGGGLLAVWAFVVAMSGTGDAQALFSIEEVVGMCFEGKEFGSNGVVQDRFEEKKVGEMSGRVGVVRKENGWALQRVNVLSSNSE